VNVHLYFGGILSGWGSGSWVVLSLPECGWDPLPRFCCVWLAAWQRLMSDLSKHLLGFGEDGLPHLARFGGGSTELADDQLQDAL
jgi:hypothetical protein